MQQCKTSFCIKIVLSGFTKDAQKKNWHWQCVHTVIFAPDLAEYAFVGVSLSDAKFMGGDWEY